MSKLRLDKYLADMGVGTRQEVKALVRKGRVAVDGITAKAPELKVDPDEAQVTVDGNSISYVKMEYWMLHKPAGVVSATEDRRDRTVLDLLSGAARKDLFPVGRLDKDTEGLLLITDDGDYVHRVITPKKHVPKVYFARTDGLPTSADAERFAQGVVLGDGTQCLPARLECLPEQGGCRVTVYEGKYHMVKRMLAGCGTPVLQLHRLSIGALTLDPALAPGAYRELSAEEAMLVFEEPAS